MQGILYSGGSVFLLWSRGDQQPPCQIKRQAFTSGNIGLLWLRHQRRGICRRSSHRAAWHRGRGNVLPCRVPHGHGVGAARQASTGCWDWTWDTCCCPITHHLRFAHISRLSVWTFSFENRISDLPICAVLFHMLVIQEFHCRDICRYSEHVGKEEHLNQPDTSDFSRREWMSLVARKYNSWALVPVSV